MLLELNDTLNQALSVEGRLAKTMKLSIGYIDCIADCVQVARGCWFSASVRFPTSRPVVPPAMIFHEACTKQA